ncbi:PKD domain-containing protein [Pedobacter petrophilus]|uniref:PKD domain-containing protein n=1 Tax=Pedobacter petrophilus TaxID=1908241 RepID=A0A7K0G2U3_9SPHI|nr:gliding motility-associated C-terminal domain-containing protein [Pedobacter petrophilus]MRX77286.1 PKD domain-containing protein [Pedobacter petrophilus]
MSKGFILAVILLLSIPFLAISQNVSNEGTDFWAVFPSHVQSGQFEANLNVFVTSKYDTEVTVTSGSFTSGIVLIPANTSVEIPVDRAASYVDVTDTRLINRGIHIVVTPGKPKVSAYAHIYAGNRSAASLILPFVALGQKYFSVNFTQSIDNSNNPGQNYLAIVAVSDNTQLKLKKKDGSEIDLPELNAGDVYEYTDGGSDLTGVSVYVDPSSASSCNRFAAFSGSSNISIADCSPRTTSSDPLYQQLYPISSLGKSYGIVPFSGQSYLYRAIAVEPNTKIYLDGVLVGTLLNAGDFYSSARMNNAAFITADKNIMLSQYMYSVGCASSTGGAAEFGDPDMVLLNPVEFIVNNITIFSSDKQRISQKFLNILIKTNKTSSFKINGAPPSITWTPLTGNPLYSFAQIPLTDNSLSLSADDGFNAIAYGYGATESYAYSAGTNLATNNYLTVVSSINNNESANGCVGVLSKFKITLPYQPNVIVWSLDRAAPVSHLELLEQKQLADGTFQYVYNSPFELAYATSGTHTIDLQANPAANAACTIIDTNLTYVFNVLNLPIADFEINAMAACANDDLNFTSKADPNGLVISNWAWDFGDGSAVIDEKNPLHKYAEEGDYAVKLLVKSVDGCWSDVAAVQTVHVNPLPVAAFTISRNISCVNADILFTDQSTISRALTASSQIVKWEWDFGDGSTPEVRLSKAPFAHQFSQVGTFSVKLTTTSDVGCTTTSAIENITVNALPVADFLLPAVCFDDRVATFINQSRNVDNTANGLSYEWSFGDNSSSTNRAVSINGDHSYSTPGGYFVTLKIKNQDGCEVATTKSFTLNGQVKTADFAIQNQGMLCNGSDVIINNLSTAFSGQITKIEVYKNAVNEPTNKITIEHPTADDIILNYNGLDISVDNEVKIKLIAYSGIVCFKEVSKIITLKAAPILSADAIAPVCENDGNVNINQFHETSGIAGDGGVYSSDGNWLSTTGTFNPKLAGAGSHNITYTFVANNGCSSSITSSIIVNESPNANAESTVFMLAGGEIKLPAVANGENLTYQWSPALALNNDKILNPMASPDEDTEYTLTVSANPSGCEAITKVLVKVLQVLIPPNSFTPNGDNVNDVWNIKYIESYPKATVTVFNRNGNKVFSSNGYQNPFDGNFQNEPLPVGVYYYIINPGNERKTITGPLTIIR